MKKNTKEDAKVFLGYPKNKDIYRKLGCDKINLKHFHEDWEAAVRTPIGEEPGWFEWHYIDARTKEGWMLINYTYNNVLTYKSKKAEPYLSVEIHFPGIEVVNEFHYSGKDFSYSKDRLNVKMGPNTLEAINGDTRHLKATMYLPKLDIEVYLELRALVPAFREGTGITCSNVDDKFIAWLVTQPFSKITGYIRKGDLKIELNGNGYSDHGFTNAMLDIWNHWHWFSFAAGPYQGLAGYNISKNNYNNSAVKTNILLAKDGKIVFHNPDKWTLERGEDHYDKESHRNRANVYYNICEEGDHRYEFDVHDTETLRVVPMLELTAIRDSNPAWLNKLIRFVSRNFTWNLTGSYRKYKATVKLRHYYKGKLEEEYETKDSLNEFFSPGSKYTPDKPPMRKQSL
ncbi:hypothetical protein JW796_03325 [Candidatus Dojkabacteria bacterium]|nr:hypothetical protein [Candidatus Dojkabacteria bacterium]